MPATSQKPDSASRNASGSAASNSQQNAQQSTSATTPAANDGNEETTPTAPKVNRPSDSRFKQQKLKAWQPILTAGTVLPTFFAIGLAFIPIGAVLFVTSNKVQEHVFDYTDDCNTTIDGQSMACKDIIKNGTLRDKLEDKTCRCTIRIVIKDKIDKPVYVYYGLTNFYQNHRRYVKSRDDIQMLGDYKHSSADCQPFEKDANGTIIYPCGAVANSMFNDSFNLSREKAPNTPEKIGLLETDIAWPSDRNKKFFNPTQSWAEVSTTVTKPPYWSKPIWQMSDDPDENGVKNEAFIVWMRTAALPTFRKLHSRVDHSGDYADSLPAGNYTISIAYNYPVDSFDGRKRFIISNTSWAGGKNPFLGVAYIVVGSLCILTGFIFLLIHMKFGKSLTELASVN